MAAHKRNTAPMLARPRCGARTRSGLSCRSPAVRAGKGAACWRGQGFGRARGNKNALKHGAYTREALERRAQMRALVREVREVLEEYR